METSNYHLSGGANLPASSLQYKRAVYKQPPKQFTVDFLPPQKQGNAYSYGMRITPIFGGGGDRRSIISRNSDNSSGSSASGSISASTTFSLATRDTTTSSLNTEYEIWRRWEDCLYFQDLLESEYDQMSREKRARLQAGKGVKKNGLYEHEDPARRLRRAASFESLPPGPDPNMIAKSLHEVLPKLAKKGTLFKASKETVEQRAQELRALIEALLAENEDLPTLIVELRNLRRVRDFFGFWRRDHDRLEKEMLALEKEKARARDADRFSSRGRSRSESLGSRASSIFGGSGLGTYFSSSNVSLQLPPSPSASETSAIPRSPQKSALRSNLTRGINEVAAPSSHIQPLRPRAHTLNSVRPHTGNYLAAPGNGIAFVSKPLASAPAQLGFPHDARDDDYLSDSASIADSFIPTPDSRTTHNSPIPTRGVRFAITDLKGKPTMSQESENEPIIVSLEEGETLSFNEDPHMFVMREHDSLLARVGRGVQDMTIQEEDEYDNDERYQHSDSSEEHCRKHELPMSRRQRRETSLSSLNTDSLFANRNGMFVRTPSTYTESDASVLSDAQSQSTSGSESSARTNTPVFNVDARAAAAHAEALRLLTGGGALRRSDSPELDWLAPPSVRSSVLTTGSSLDSGSGSSGFGTRHESSDTQSSSGVRPSSFQSSVLSCADIDKCMSMSPVVLHLPIEDEDDKIGNNAEKVKYEIENTDALSRHITTGRRIKTRESMVSMQTVMTDYSVDLSASIYGNPEFSDEVLKSIQRSLKIDASEIQNEVALPNTESQVQSERASVMSESQSTEGGEDILDSYFYAFSYPSLDQEVQETQITMERSGSSDNEHTHGALSQPSKALETFETKTTRQSHDPWSRSHSISPSHIRDSIMTTDLFPIPVSFAFPPPSSSSPPSVVSTRASSRKACLRENSNPHSSPLPSPNRGKTSPAPPTPTPSTPHTPSIKSESGVTGNSLMVKAVYGIHIIAFRVDRSTPLTEVRDKLRHKLVDQQGIPLAGDITLGYKRPPINPGGRARSNSASSTVGTHGNLIIISTQKDWKEALSSCTPGAKLTLHVLDVYNSK